MKAIVVYYVDIAWGKFVGVEVDKVMVFSDEEFAMLNEQDIDSLVRVAGRDSQIYYQIIDVDEMNVKTEKAIKNVINKKS